MRRQSRHSRLQKIPTGCDCDCSQVEGAGLSWLHTGSTYTEAVSGEPLRGWGSVNGSRSSVCWSKMPESCWQLPHQRGFGSIGGNLTKSWSCRDVPLWEHGSPWHNIWLSCILGIVLRMVTTVIRSISVAVWKRLLLNSGVPTLHLQ